jgi:hypothetical protein
MASTAEANLAGGSVMPVSTATAYVTLGPLPTTFVPPEAVANLPVLVTPPSRSGPASWPVGAGVGERTAVLGAEAGLVDSRAVVGTEAFAVLLGTGGIRLVGSEDCDGPILRENAPHGRGTPIGQPQHRGRSHDTQQDKRGDQRPGTVPQEL